MALAAQRAIGFFHGYPTTASVPLTLLTFSADSDLVVTCNGVTYTVAAATLAAQKLGNDRGADDGASQRFACYYAHVRLTGLQPFTRYPVTLEQTQGYTIGTAANGARSHVVLSDLSVLTAPEVGTDFAFYHTTCDRSFTSASGAGYRDGGGWNVIAARLRAGEKLYLVHGDDWSGYIDRMPGSDVAVTGKERRNTTADNVAGGFAAPVYEYDYALGYLTGCGMLGDTSVESIAWGRQADRLYCLQNMPCLIQFGDHEFSNNCGFSPAPGVPASSSPTYTAGLAVWTALYDNTTVRCLPPSARNLDATAHHWHGELGDAKFASMDRVTNGSADLPALGGGVGVTTIFGANQIKDHLAALNTAHPFKFDVMTCGVKYWDNFGIANVTQSEGDFIEQQALKDNVPAEHALLYTATGNTPKSVSDNDALNGTDGVYISLHGDTHRQNFILHHTEGFTAWYSGGIGNAGPRGNVLQWVRGDTFDGSVLGYTSDPGVVTPSGVFNGCLRVDVYGADTPKRIRVSLLDRYAQGGEVAGADYLVGSNFPQEYDPFAVSAGQPAWQDPDGQADGIENTTATRDVPTNNLICDRTGFRQPVSSGLRKEWTGAMIRPQSWEPRHPQDYVRAKAEHPQGSPRPEPADRFLSTNEVSTEDL